MDGMDFMIRLFLVLLSLSGCGNLPIAYLQNFSEVNNVIFGFPDYKITKDIFEPIISKLYPFNLDQTHPFITQLLPLSRIVMFDDNGMKKYGKLLKKCYFVILL